MIFDNLWQVMVTVTRSNKGDIIMNENTSIGKAIGSIKHTLKVSQYKGGPSTQITIEIDFSTASDQDIKGWLVSNRVIAGQRPWRDLSENALEALNGQTFAAQSIGQKVKSREEKVQALINAGLPTKLAEFSVDNPEEFNKVVGGISTSVAKDEQSTIDDNY